MKSFKFKNNLQLGVVTIILVIGMAMFSGLDHMIFGTGDVSNTGQNRNSGQQAFGGTNSGMKKIVEAHWQGMEIVPLTWEIAAKLGIPIDEKGVLVDEVTLYAAASGLRARDIIKSVNGVKVFNLDDFYKTTKRIRNKNSVSIEFRRIGREENKVQLVVPDVLGFAQLESAPMILPGSIPPHRHRGVCTECHQVGTTGELNPDPDTITLSPPVISKKTKSPHRYRGKCKTCHVLK